MTRPSRMLSVSTLLLSLCLACASENDLFGPPTDSTRNPTGAPELPRVAVDSRFVAATGRTLLVPAGASLQVAIDTALPGDQILLTPGVTYAGNFTLKKKSGDGWITIRTAATNAQLPPEGTRISPAYASIMPKIVSPNGQEVFQTELGAHHYRLLGLEITASDTVTFHFGLVLFGEGGAPQTSLDVVPHHLVIDRSWIHGRAGMSTKRCVSLNSGTAAIVDSYMSECAGSGVGQAICGWNGPGPYKIENNFLEGGLENIMFGGSDPTIQGLIPSDIVIRRNHLFKPMSWQGAADRTVKNSFELKSAQRVLFEGNVLENSWVNGQIGFGILLKSQNQDGNCRWCVTRHVTIRYNRIIHTAGGISLSGQPIAAGVPDEYVHDVLIQHNTFENVGAAELGTNGRLIQISDSLKNITFERNTGFAPSHTIVFAAAQPLRGLVIRDNIFGRGQYGIRGGDATEGTATLELMAPRYVFEGNVIVGASAAQYPAGNNYPSSILDVGFTNASTWDYRLQPGSQYIAAGTGGRTPGADVDAVLAATAGVVQP